MRSKRGRLRVKPGSGSPLSVRYLATDEILLNKRNPNRHERRQIEKIARSITKFGFLVPLLIDRNRTVLAGEGRLRAAMLLGITQVPTIEVDHLDPHQAAAFLIADNELCRRAEWDKRLLGQIFLELSQADIDFSLEITGFSTTEIDLLIEGLGDSDGSEDDEVDRFEPASRPPVTKPGDVWVLGPHRIACGDARDTASYEALMAGTEAAAVFTDPPYNLKIDGHVSGLGRVRHREFAMASGEMNEVEYIRFLKDFLRSVAGRCRDGAIIYVFIDWRHLAELLAAARATGLRLINLCVWVKHNAGMGSFYRSQHELVLVLKSGRAPHRNNIELGRHGRNRSNVWQYRGANDFGRGTEEGKLLELHPTPKPVAMFADGIRDCTERNDIVLDPFLGSGTTLIAAERIGRVCYGIELDPLHVDTAVRRWQSLTGKSAICAATRQAFDQQAKSEERHVAKWG